MHDYEIECPKCGNLIAVKSHTTCPKCGTSFKIRSQDVSKYKRTIDKADKEISKLKKILKKG